LLRISADGCRVDEASTRVGMGPGEVQHRGSLGINRETNIRGRHLTDTFDHASKSDAHGNL